MRPDWEAALERWAGAKLLDPAAAERIREYERRQKPETGIRWQVILALASGAIMLAAGVLLFVAAHWDSLSPAARFVLVLSMIAVFHFSGALTARRFPALATTLHGIGTIALGGGIFLAGQIFNLEEHWPGGVMLWAFGACVGWLLLRDWVQAALTSVLLPAWLISEWVEATSRYRGNLRVPAAGALLLVLAYLMANVQQGTSVRRALRCIGAISVIPATAFAAAAAQQATWDWRSADAIPLSLNILGWAAAVCIPLLLAWLARGRHAWMNAAATPWAVLLVFSHVRDHSFASFSWSQLGPYVLCALGSMGLVAWGIQEQRKEGVNLGLAGLAITVFAFYFSQVMDKLGRSVALMGFGLVLLIVAWGLERTRKRLMARMAGGAQ